MYIQWRYTSLRVALEQELEELLAVVGHYYIVVDVNLYCRRIHSHSYLYKSMYTPLYLEYQCSFCWLNM